MRQAVLPAVLGTERVGDPSAQGLELAAVVPIAVGASFMKADYPYVRAIRVGNTITLVNSLPDSYPIPAPSLGEFAAWSPTVGGLTVGSGVQVARYTRQGDLVTCTYSFTLGAGSAVTGALTISAPVTAFDMATTQIKGEARLLDTGVTTYPAVVLQQSTTSFEVRCMRADVADVQADVLSSTNPFTWAAADSIGAHWSYEAATPSNVPVELFY